MLDRLKNTLHPSKVQAFAGVLQLVAFVVVSLYAYGQYKQNNALSYVDRFYTGDIMQAQAHITTRTDLINLRFALLREVRNILEESWPTKQTQNNNSPTDNEIYDQWQRSLAIADDSITTFYSYLILQLYDEIAKCDQNGLCDHDTLVHLLRERIKTHHNLLYPIMATKMPSDIGDDYLEFLSRIKYCEDVDVPIVRYDEIVDVAHRYPEEPDCSWWTWPLQ